MKNQACRDKEEYNLNIAKLKKVCYQKVQEANDKVVRTEQKYLKDNALAAKAKKEAEVFKAEQEKLLKEEKAKIDQLAKQKISDKIATLESDKEREIFQIESDYKKSIKHYKTYYATKHIAKELWYATVRMFCIVWLIMQALCSDRLKSEAVIFWGWIKDFMLGNCEAVPILVELATNATMNINNEIIATLLYWLVYVIVTIVSVAVFCIFPVVSVGGGCCWYLTSKYFDTFNKWVMVGTGILFIAMSSKVSYTLKINVLLIWLIIQVSVPFVRFLIMPLVKSLISCLYNKWMAIDIDKRKDICYNINTGIVSICSFFLILWYLQVSATRFKNF